MPKKLWWGAMGLVLALVGTSGVVAVVINVIMPLVQTAIMPQMSPLMAPICPGNPICG